MTYKQITEGQRYQIYALKKKNHSQKEIAEVIGVHPSTVSRELKRNKGQRGYRPQQAHQKALARRNKAQKRISAETWEVVREKLNIEWSPEQITGWLRREEAASVSHEWIYQYVLADKQAGGELYKRLRCQKQRRKRYGTYDRRGQIVNRTSIEKRPSGLTPL